MTDGDPALRLSQIRERLQALNAASNGRELALWKSEDVEYLLDLVSDLIRLEQALRHKLGEKKDGELCCGSCGGPHQFDTSVPSVIWNEVIRAQELDEFLCTSCILKEFVKKGRSFTATLWRGELGFHGVPIEVQIRSQAANDAHAIQEENNALRWKLHEAEDRADALRAYVQHHDNCELRDTWTKQQKCTCGLSSLVERTA